MAVGDITFSSDDLVKTSPNDRRLYRYIELPNGLCALLIHDPEIYADGPTKAPGKCQGTEDEDEEEEEDESDYEDEEEDEEGDDEEDEDEDNSEGEERYEDKKKGSSHKKAAAAMCVGMGSFSDPFEAQGLAHFLGLFLQLDADGFTLNFIGFKDSTLFFIRVHLLIYF